MRSLTTLVFSLNIHYLIHTQAKTEEHLARNWYKYLFSPPALGTISDMGVDRSLWRLSHTDIRLGCCDYPLLDRPLSAPCSHTVDPE